MVQAELQGIQGNEPSVLDARRDTQSAGILLSYGGGAFCCCNSRRDWVKILEVADESKLSTAQLHERHRQAAWNDGVVKVYDTAEERAMLEDQRRRVVSEWPATRIAALKDSCQVPVTRITALLGISRPAFSRLAGGEFTPSASLCLRMAQLEEMAAAGELHRGKQVIPTQREQQRRMSHFRSWWFNRPPTAEFPMVSVEIVVKWGGAPYQHMRLPVQRIPKLRLQKFEGLVGIVRTVTSTLRKLAQANSRLYWNELDNEYWTRYANDTLPEIVLERAQITRRAAAARKKETNGISDEANLPAS